MFYSSQKTVLFYLFPQRLPVILPSLAVDFVVKACQFGAQCVDDSEDALSVLIAQVQSIEVHLRHMGSGGLYQRGTVRYSGEYRGRHHAGADTCFFQRGERGELFLRA